MNVLMVLSLGFDRPGPSLHLLSAVMRGLAARGDRVHVIQKLSGETGRASAGRPDTGSSPRWALTCP